MINWVKKRYLILVVVPFVVGLIGFLIPQTHDLFIQLTPLMLLYSLALVLIEELTWTKENVLKLLAIGLFAFAAEYIGVQYGYLFGSYNYGQGIGPKVVGVPLLIGVNWVFVVVGSRSLAMRFSKSWIGIALIASIVATLFDVLLEPVAISQGWWAWSGGGVPLFNYMTWFGLTLVFQAVLAPVTEHKNRGYIILLVEGIFFASLLLLH